MKFRHTIFLFALLMLLVQPIAAQKKITKRFVQTPLSEVLAEIEKQTGYSIMYKTNEVNGNKLITASFKDASANTVLKKVLDFNLEYKIQKSMIVIGKRPPVVKTVKQGTSQADVAAESSLTQTYKASAQDSVQLHIDSIVATTHTRVEHRIDTVLNITTEILTQEKQKPAKKPKKETRKGHYLEGYLGVGYGGIDYKLQDGKDVGFVSGLGQINYAYFFTPEWGIGAGLDFANYTTTGISNALLTWPGQTDSDGETYTHRSKLQDWKERQNLLSVGIPITAQYQHWWKTDGKKGEDKIGIFAEAGIKVGIPFAGTYAVKDGLVNHTGWYEPWQLELDHLHDFAEQQNAKQSGKFTTNPTVAATATVGALFPLKKNLDLMVGIYFNYSFNSCHKSSSDALGFYEEGVSPEYYSGFMNQYQGLPNSTQIDGMRPFAVGVKVGLHWHIKKKEQPKPIVYERVLQNDTTISYIDRYDTIQVVEYDTILHPINAIKQLQLNSIIWFDLDDYTPKLDPPTMLDDLAEILVQNPDIIIEVNGHTCGLGGVEYNQRLSLKRANAVADILVRKGVKREQLVIQGFGQSKPYYSESHQLFLDRRVEIKPIEK
jgi:outer membrane protein OmpA-like peptidoglycan-associated protein